MFWKTWNTLDLGTELEICLQYIYNYKLHLVFVSVSQVAANLGEYFTSIYKVKSYLYKSYFYLMLHLMGNVKQNENYL